MTTEKQAVKTLADAIAKATRLMIEENNKRYVNNQVKNVELNSSSSGGGGTISDTIPASHVTGLYNTVAGYIINAQSSAEQGDVIAGRILSTLNGIASIQVSRATIDTAQITNLKAGVAEIVHLTTQTGTIEDATIRQLKADIANVGLTNIGTANIDYAHVKDLTADTAIFRDGVGGNLYIDRLAVTDANIVSLTAGEIMLRDSNDNLVRLYVDSETGEIETETVAFDGDDIINSNSMNATKIVQNSITARELNVSSIFADSALIAAIKARNIDTTDLFADNAFLAGIYTNTIQNASAGTDIDISSNTQITLLKNRLALIVEDGSTSSNIILTPGMITAVSEQVEIDADTIDLSANTSIGIVAKSIVQEEMGYFLTVSTTSEMLSNTVTQATLSATLYQGKTNVTSSTDANKFNWLRVSSDSSADATWNSNHTGMKSITVVNSEVDDSTIFKCEYINGGAVVASDSRTITDMSESTEEGLNAFVESTNGNKFRNTINQTVLKCRIFSISSEVDTSGSYYLCSWYRVDEDGRVVDWDAQTARRTGKSINVTSADIIGNKTTFVCEVIDQEESSPEDRLKATCRYTIVNLVVDTSGMDNRLTSIETSITEQSGQIALMATKTEVNQVAGRVTTTENQISALNVGFDNIALTVATTTVNYRQAAMPDNPSDGEIWVQTSGSSVVGTYQYKVVDQIGSWIELKTDDMASMKITVNGLSSTVTNQGGRLSTVEQTASGLSTAVYDPSTGLSAVGQQANKISWIVASGTSSSNMTLTNDALSVIADNIDLEANNTIQIHTTDQIDSTVLAGIDLTENRSVHIYAANQIDIAAVNGLNLSGNQAIIDIKSVTDDVSTWYEFSPNGLRTQKKDASGQHVSKWSTYIDNVGFYVDHDDVLPKHVGAFYKETASFRSIQLSKTGAENINGIYARATTGGGWAWTE